MTTHRIVQELVILPVDMGETIGVRPVHKQHVVWSGDNMPTDKDLLSAYHGSYGKPVALDEKEPIGHDDHITTLREVFCAEQVLTVERQRKFKKLGWKPVERYGINPDFIDGK